MNPFKYLKAAYFWTTAFLWTGVLYCGVISMRILDLLTGRKDGVRVHRIATIWGRSMIALMPGWRVTIDGGEHLPHDAKSLVIVANHESMSDIWAMYYLGIQFRWLSKAEAFRLPMIGRTMKWAGYVPIVRGNAESHAAAMRDCEAKVRMGLPMFFFPEGTRSRDGQVKAFKSGAFRLARDTQAPVLPLAIHGAGELLRKGSLIPAKTAHVQIKVLPEIPPPGPSDDLDAYAEKVRSMIIAAHAGLV